MADDTINGTAEPTWSDGEVKRTSRFDVKDREGTAIGEGFAEFTEYRENQDGLNQLLADVSADKLVASFNAQSKIRARNAVVMTAKSDTTEKKMARILRSKAKGELSAEDAKAQLAELMATL